MLSASDTQEFIPYGRQCLVTHPGKQQARMFNSNVIDHGLPLVKALKDIRLNDKPKVTGHTTTNLKLELIELIVFCIHATTTITLKSGAECSFVHLSS